jgi:hypothetical protein
VIPGNPASYQAAKILRAQIMRESNLILTDEHRDAVKLMIDYLYEGEYEPKLPAGCPTIFGTQPKFSGEATEKKYGYSYQFPHTCVKAAHCETKVCPHHDCYEYDCTGCVNFICRTCCYTWIPPMQTTADHMLLHYHMYQLGKKYAVVGLSDLACEKFEQWCEKHWDDDNFLVVGNVVFSNINTDDQSLKDALAKTVSNHMCLLNKPTVQDWMQKANGLAVGLVKLRAKDLGWVKPDAAK